MHIPLVDLYRQTKPLDKKIHRKIEAILKKGDYVLGRGVGEFEKSFASYIGAEHCIGVASGTDALLLSLQALGVGRGDEVIVPAMTFIATLLPILYLGAKPILVDVLPDSPIIEPMKVEMAITNKTKVIIPVHLHGFIADIHAIMAIAKKYNLSVIEDACQAHGAEIRIQQFSNDSLEQRKTKIGIWKKAGSIGNIGCFSFYPAKNLGAIGDGGAIVTSDSQLAEKIAFLRNYGQSKKYHHDIVGYNSRLDTIQAAVLALKLDFLDTWNEKRRQLARLYDSLLKDLPLKIPENLTQCKPVYHIYQVQTKKRDALALYLETKGISTGIHYPVPLHMQKALAMLGRRIGDFPNSEQFAKETLSLPMFPELKDSEVMYISRTIGDFFRSHS